MSLDLETGAYYSDVHLPTTSCALTFKISATDDVGLTSETEIYIINFENAEAGPSPIGPFLGILAGLAILGAAGASIAYIILKKPELLFKKKPDEEIDTGSDISQSDTSGDS